MNLLHRAAEALSRIVTGETPDINQLEALVNEIETSKASDSLTEIASNIYGSDDVEIDGDAVTSRGDDGTWVSAWVRVFAGEEGGDEDSDDD